MRTLLILVRKDFANFSRNRTAVSLTFIVPIALIYIFGQVFGLNRADRGPHGIPLAVVKASQQPAADKLIEALRAEKAFTVVTTRPDASGVQQPLTEAMAREMIRRRELRFALVLPEDLLPKDRFGIRLKILSNPLNEIETQTVNGLLQKTIFSSVPELLGQSLQARARDSLGDARLEQFNRTIAAAIAGAFGGDKAEIERNIAAGDLGFGAMEKSNRQNTPGAENRAGNLLNSIVAIEREQVVGSAVKAKTATSVVGGWAIMFLLFAISGSSAAFFDEKNSGIFQRLLSAPITRGQLLGARFCFGILLGVVQLVVMFSAGSLMYGIDVLGHFGPLVIVSIAAAAACTSFGMLIAAFAPNAQAASGLATFLVMIMSATGGAWFPISLMPEFMQTIGKFTIVYWSMEGFAAVLWNGQGVHEILPILGVLLGITTGVMTLAIWRLNRKPLFG